MTEEVINFPRGGKRRAVSKDNQPDFREEDLFQADHVSPAKKAKKDGKKKEFKKKKLKHQQMSVEPLNFQSLKEDQVVLGMVKEVKDHQMMVSLPNGLAGMVTVMEVSSPLTKRLQQVAQAEANSEETLETLKDLYQIGDPVPCCVVTKKTEGHKRLIDLSVNPILVNKGLPLSALKTGCLLYGAVISKEEHGYTVDLGIPGITAFLKAEPGTENLPLVVGKCLWLCLRKNSDADLRAGESRVVHVSTAPERVQRAMVTPQMVTSLECIRPGMKMEVKIVQTGSEGLQVKYQQYSGCIHKRHLPKSPASYKIGLGVEARVLYTAPLTKAVYLSLLPAVVNGIGTKPLPVPVSVGEIGEWKVKHVDKTHGVYFQAQNVTGFASVFEVSDQEIKDLHTTFGLDTAHRCRVIGFHHIDNLALLSLKESVLNERFLSIKDIHLGQVVKCHVLQIHNSGLIVQLSKHVTALVPNLHVADVPIKNIEKKFPKGKKLQCRVLKVDHQKKKLLLTNKKSLVSSRQKFPASYFKISPGDFLEGWVIGMKTSGIVVAFCNDVKGWVPRSELSTEEIVHPETLFYRGQVVRCRVVSCKPEEGKLKLSLILVKESPVAEEQEKMEGVEVGKLVEAMIVKKEKDHFLLKLQPSGVLAILNKEHLSDTKDNQELLWRAWKPGQIVKDLMLLKQANVVVTTLKESHVSAAREGIIPKSFSDLQQGQLLPGVIKNHQSYGIFVEVPGGLTGLVPQKFTTDKKVPDLTSTFACGQSVVVKIMQIKEENKRFLCSLRMCDCYSDDPSVGQELLTNYLRERELWMHAFLVERACQLKAGSLEMLEVVEATKYGCVCKTAWGMRALVLQTHAGKLELMEGSKVEGVVLHVDAINERLVMSTDIILVQDVSRRIKKPDMDKALVGQCIKAEVVFVTEEFVLVALKQHAVGMFAYIPTKQHLNDVMAKAAFSIGEQIRVVIQKADGTEVLADLETRIPSAMSRKGKLTVAHSFQLGQVVTAVVRTILPGQLNIQIGRFYGRVHVSEVVDKIEQGGYVYKGYSKGQEVKVKIIGLRSWKTQKYLPISHPKFRKAMPECTLKPSKLDHDGCVDSDVALCSQMYETGCKILVYPIQYKHNKLWVNVSPMQRGVISVFDLSHDLMCLQRPEKVFLPCHAYSATVISVEDNGLLHLSLTGRKEQVLAGCQIVGKVTSVSEKGMYLRLPDDYRGKVPPEDPQFNFQDVKVGQFLKVYVESCLKKEKCTLWLSKPHSSDSKLLQSKTVEPSKASKTVKLSKPSKTVESAKPSKTVQSAISLDNKNQKGKTMEPSKESKTVELAKPSKIVQSEIPSDKNQKRKLSHTNYTKVQKPSGPEAPLERLNIEDGFLWEPRKSVDLPRSDEDDAEEDVTDEEPEIKKRKKSGKTSGPAESAGGQPVDFDRLLLSQPDNSLLWIQYMSKHLSEGDIDRARAVAEQALKTISFREEREKLNIWVALLNLENIHGSKEQVASTLQRALQVNDPLTLYLRVAAMYTTAEQFGDAEQIYQIMVRKFKQNKQLWVEFALFLFKQGRPDAARNLLQRSLLSLEKRDYVETIAKFAQLEYSHGNPERGATMFEKIIAEFPRRSDIMSVYIDMVTKLGDIQKARELLDRGLASKSAQFFLKKYLQFEEKHGNDKTRARIQELIEKSS